LADAAFGSAAADRRKSEGGVGVPWPFRMRLSRCWREAEAHQDRGGGGEVCEVLVQVVELLHLDRDEVLRQVGLEGELVGVKHEAEAFLCGRRVCEWARRWALCTTTRCEGEEGV
jgi:hypothetical protein